MNLPLFLSLLAWPIAIIAWPAFFVNLYWHFEAPTSIYVVRVQSTFLSAYISTALLISLP